MISNKRKSKGDYYTASLVRLPYQYCGFNTPRVIKSEHYRTPAEAGLSLFWLVDLVESNRVGYRITVEYVELLT